jgi:hypothetical protein
VGHQDERQRERWKAMRAPISARMANSNTVTSQAILEALTSPDQLRTWLEAKPPDAVVGNYQTRDESILANFLWDRLGIYVMTFDFILYEEEDIAFPPWCALFNRVELERYAAQPPPGADWTAEAALAIVQKTQQQL